mmetsp:Transcript_32452/g.48041  ORF Transcript_32452/g.48041 Transcript_32452/m.48041 type:complete len:197 (-) Transcript_32452:175-765(-)|eukprot:CAMPEP_0194227260 /NCGR_PEP_ID=MMETSP0156-20130528/42765_1 /TAXON_ID=33649 /ORGANISM="Thalassionema nitzschioides, Strain L26-B" /LENGTH=196 /DNA_ID=CAMNT_0038959739 /DNA_START=49 /DNA_END=639 /DNA_ORIENTATION=-
MKVSALLLSLAVSAAAFSQQSRRETLAKIAAGAAFVPAAANAAAGESPRFSVFGLIGDGTSYSEGAAYGSDQASKLYSPYSVYGEEADSLYDPTNPAINERKKKILVESKVRLGKLDRYISRKEWFNVIDELNRYMYETRGAVAGLASTPNQKEAAADFFKAIEETNLAARLKKQDKCFAAAKSSMEKLDAFTASL